MGFVLTIICVMTAADLWWWHVARRAIRRAGLARGYRIATDIFMGGTVLGILLIVIARVTEMTAMIMPEEAVIIVYVWHFLLLPVVAIPSLLIRLMTGTVSLVRRYLLPPPPPEQPSEANVAGGETGFDRRAFLARVVVVAPPLATLALTGRSIQNLDHVIVRNDTITLPGLPPALDGLRIAHISDPHIGSFMSEEKYQRLIDMTNELDADLVLQTGDLINASLKDLPDGIQMLRKFRAKFGVYSCQGNHDCIDSRDRFERDTTQADVGLLLDAGREIDVRGHRVALLGPRWWGRDERVLRWSVKQLNDRLQGNTFPILLAHHPHCYDTAIECGIPLTLAGHTHGGQLALSRNIGFGPIMYRYWQGVYQSGVSALNVSAGTGNWFPLRMGMPCEIVHLTLRRA